MKQTNLLTQLKIEIDKHKLMRKKGFPFIMGEIKKYNEDQDKVYEAIKGPIDTYINDYWDVLQLINREADKIDWKVAFLMVISRDFFDKGLLRERMALELLKMANSAKDYTFSRDTDYELECNGIDIVGETRIVDKYPIYISVKGKGFHNTEAYQAHVDKLSNWKKGHMDSMVAIMEMDESNSNYCHIIKVKLDV